MNPTVIIAALAMATMSTDRGRSFLKTVFREIIKTGYELKEEAKTIIAEAKEEARENIDRDDKI